MKFTSINIENNNNQIMNSNYAYSEFGNQASCSVTNSNHIACFYNHLDGYMVFGTILSYDSELNCLDVYNLYDFYGSTYSFMKSIHLKEEIVVFAYYNFSEYNAYATPQLLKLFFCQLNNGMIEEYFINKQSFISLDKYEFCINETLNDMIRISENEICVISTTDQKDILYIVLIDIVETKKIIIRYYKIKLYN